MHKALISLLFKKDGLSVRIMAFRRGIKYGKSYFSSVDSRFGFHDLPKHQTIQTL